MKPADSSSYVPRGSAILPISARKSAPTSESLCGGPELTITIARDKHSSGISVWLRTPSGSRWPHIKLVMSERWNDALPGERGLYEIVIQAMQQLLRELGTEPATKGTPDS